MKSPFVPVLLVVFQAFPALASLPPSANSARDALQPTVIRVRVAEAVPHVSVHGFDLRVYESRGQRKLASSPPKSSEWELRCQDGRVRALSGATALDLREPVTISSLSGFVSVSSIPYRETIEIRSTGSFCEVINLVDIEKYLDGVVNAEFNARWNEEAIGAQVIAARTYALHQIRVARADPDRHFDVDATTSDQVYAGSRREDFRASRAVERTRGMVLTVGDATRPLPLKAFYHSTCGGVTELPQHVWGGNFEGFKRPVVCPYCRSSPALSWKLELPASEVEKTLRRSAAVAGDAVGKAWKEILASGGKLESLQAGAVNEEGRVARVTSIWRIGARRIEVEIPGARFRDWIGPARFRSAAFQLSRDASGWKFEGRGNGHGVGMCQWGAKTMGEKGFKTAAILRHYYPDAVLRKLW
jgi:stage II sporulation protein D